MPPGTPRNVPAIDMGQYFVHNLPYSFNNQRFDSYHKKRFWELNSRVGKILLSASKLYEKAFNSSKETYSSI
jgi:hypothetical protein